MKQFFTPTQCLFLVLFLCIAKLSSAQMPYMVKDLNSGGFNSPNNLINVNGILFFTAYDVDNEHGEELWRSDGTAAGTYMVKDINPGGGSSDVSSLTNINGTLFFRASDGSGFRLWKTNGTEEGTVMVLSGTNAPTPGYIVNVNGTVYFTGSTSAYGSELWKSDGTASGTSLVKDINTGASGSFMSYLTNVNGTLYFRTAFNSTQSIWKSDGTEQGTVLVKQFNTPNADITNLTNVNGTLFLTLDDQVHGKELWKSNGTEAGTVMVKEMNPGTVGANIGNLVVMGNNVYFSAYSPAYGQELWQSDGTDEGTKVVKDIAPGDIGSNLQLFSANNGNLYFTIDDGINGRELWKTDGTADGTVLLKDINEGSSGSSISSFVNANGVFYFTAYTSAEGEELWKSNGTTEGTVLVKDIMPGYESPQINTLTAVGGKLYFLATITINAVTYNETIWSLGTCTTANTTINTLDKASAFNSQVQSSPTTTCYCNVFNELITTIEATGNAPLSGNIDMKVWNYESFAMAYAKRQYQLYPDADPDNATAKVTLYYTQSDFDYYNINAGFALKIPFDSSETAAISSILIEKRAGTSSNDTGWPITYSGSVTKINPEDSDIIWNSAARRWEVSFETTGMGGFILKSPTLTVPVEVSVNRNAICSGTPLSLSAYCSQGTLNWYTGASGGTSIGTSSSVEPLVVLATSTTTYYAACEYGVNSSNRIATEEVVVTEMPTIPVDVMVANANICSGQSAFLTATCPIGTIVWYNAASDGDYIGTGNNVTPTPTSNTTYYAACENGDCKSERVATSEVTITQQPLKPTGVSVDKTAICSGTEIILTANCAIGTITWYNEEEGGTAIGTGNNLSQTPYYSYTYYATCENGSCVTQRIATDYVYVTAQPTNPTEVSVSETTICNGATIVLLASCEIGDPTWYTQATGGTSIGINSSLNQTPSSATTYYIACENRSCISERVLAGEVAVRPTPAKPTNLSQWGTTACTGGSVGLNGSCSGATLKWYESATATTPVYQGFAVYANPTRTITYYAACETTYCSSERVAMQEIVYYQMPVNPTGVTVNKTAICNGESITLSASCAIGDLKWIRVYTTGGVEQYDLIPTLTPDITSTYYAYCMNGTCISDYLPTDTVVVTEQPSIPTNLFQGGTQLCAGTGIYLNASCAKGTLTWYDSSTGGTVLGTGEFFIGRPTTTTTYYVACENGNCKSQRVAMNQIVVHEQPVNPTGVAVSKTAICNGETIMLSGTCLIGTISWYKTSMDSDTAFTYKPKVNTVYHATCSNGNCFSETVDAPEVVVTQQPASPTNVSVSETVICKEESITLTATCSLGTVTWYNSSTGNTILGTGNTLNHSPTVTTKYYAACVNSICSSGRISTETITVKPKPVAPVIAGRNAICAGESVILSASALANDPTTTFLWSTGSTNISITITPTTTTNYRAIANFNGCISDSSALFTVTVNRVPEQPSITADNSTICRGNTVVLTGQCASMSDSFYWSNSATTNADVPSGNYKSTRAITEPGTYKGWCESNTGCKGAEKSIVVTAGTNCGGKNFITVTPAKPVICPGSSVTLTAAGCSGTITWTGGVSSQTGTSISVSPGANITYLAQCSAGGFASVDVVVAASAVVVGTNITTGTEQVKALNTIESARKIGDPDFSPAAVVSYEAGKAITLKPGFVADYRSVFKAEIKGCN